MIQYEIGVMVYILGLRYGPVWRRLQDAYEQFSKHVAQAPRKDAKAAGPAPGEATPKPSRRDSEPEIIKPSPKKPRVVYQVGQKKWGNRS